MITEQDPDRFARVAYAAYRATGESAPPWINAHSRVHEVMRQIAAAVRREVLAQEPVPPEGPPPCVHSWQVVDYWRDLGNVVLFCTHCAVLERKEVPR